LPSFIENIAPLELPAEYPNCSNSSGDKRLDFGVSIAKYLAITGFKSSLNALDTAGAINEPISS